MLAVTNGSPVAFAASATGQAPFAYRWRKWGGAFLAGQTNANLAMASVSLSDSGDYLVDVTDARGFEATASVNLNVLSTTTSPSVLAGPSNMTVVAGATVQFNVRAGGSVPLSYQWRHGLALIPSANATNLVLTNVQSSAAGDYSVVVSNLAGTAASLNATLTVMPRVFSVSLVAPSSGVHVPSTNSILIQADVLNNYAALKQVDFYRGAALIGTASSAPFRMSWNSLPIGVSVLTARATDLTGVIITSAPVSITVDAIQVAPVLGTYPNWISVRFGGDVQIPIEAAGSTPLRCQWQLEGEDLADAGNVSGVHSNVLTIRGAQPTNAGNYQLIVTNAAGETVSDYIYLNVEDESVFVMREVPVGYFPGERLTIRLRAVPPPDTTVYAIEETIPLGWQVTNVQNGSFDALNSKVKFGPFLDNLARSLSYDLVPPLSAIGYASVYGVATRNSEETYVGGTSEMNTLAESIPHPADLDEDNVMSIFEVTSYMDAWRRGESWWVSREITLPGVDWEKINRRIPVSFTTRAAALWKGGELYYYTPRFKPPICWTNITMQAALAPIVRRNASDNTTNFALRSFAASYHPGAALPVAIQTTLADAVLAHALEEQPPAGWLVTNINEGGVWDEVNGVIKWGPFFDHAPRTLAYDALPPLNAAGPAQFAGTLSFDGDETVIGGSDLAAGVNPASAPAAGMQLIWQSDGSVQLVVNLAPDVVCRVQASSNLQDWGDLFQGIPPNGLLFLGDPDSRQAPYRFYRLILP
jgi:hypothetical protein